MAYNFPNCFAIEFDANQNPQFHDPSDNHVAVHGSVGGGTNGPAENIFLVNPQLTYTPAFDLSVEGRATEVSIVYTNGKLFLYVTELDGLQYYFSGDIDISAYFSSIADGTAWFGFTGGSSNLHSINQITNIRFYEYNVDVSQTIVDFYDPLAQIGVPTTFVVQLVDINGVPLSVSGDYKGAFLSFDQN